MTNKLIIDGDLIAYRMSAIAEERSIEVTHKSSGNKKKFKNRTEFKDFLSKKNFPYEEDKYSIVDLQTPLSGGFSISKKAIRKVITEMMDYCFVDDCEIYIGSPAITFRQKLPLPSAYKNNRSFLQKPLFLSDCKDYMINSFGAVLCDKDLEADDVVNIRCYEELAKGNNPILATLDKDSMQSEGVNILVWTDEHWKLRKIPEVGDIWKDGPTYKGEGMKFLAFQVLNGDPTDTYKPSEVCGVRYGGSTVMKKLKDKNTPKEILETIIEEYKRLYSVNYHYVANTGEAMIVDWKFMLKMYWKCAYMKRSWNDDSNFWTFASKYGINEKDY